MGTYGQYINNYKNKNKNFFKTISSDFLIVFYIFLHNTFKLNIYLFNEVSQFLLRISSHNIAKALVLIGNTRLYFDV